MGKLAFVFQRGVKNPSFHLNINSHLHDFNAITAEERGISRNNDSHAHDLAFTFLGSSSSGEI